jgi:pimeloyl-ACP methyl ester carboxylesterase
MTNSISPESLAAALTSDDELVYRLHGFEGRIRLGVEAFTVDLVVADGEPLRVESPAGDVKLELFIPAAVLEQASLPVIPPGYEGIIYPTLKYGAKIIGDISVTAPLGGAIARLYTLLQVANGADRKAKPAAAHALFKETDNAVGRYVYVTVDDVEYRIYYETSGTGSTVLLLQHTAGADGRQWRHQLADPEFQSRFRVIAYDLPFHGRSLPPTGTAWWSRAYLPTKSWIEKVVVALADALELDKPIFMGCSVGGQLALDLSADYGSRFAATVSINGTYENDLKIGDPGVNDWDDLCRYPQVSEENYTFAMYASTSPEAVEAFRREVYWIYKSNAQGIYAGDNDYYSWGHDLSINGHNIDTDRTPTYLLAGEYDPASPDPTRGGPAAAEKIPGLQYRVLPGIGHFAPTDEPVLFNAAVIPILDEILDLVNERTVARSDAR